jgi:hypothetical protein
MGSVVRFKPDLKPKIEMYYGFRGIRIEIFFCFFGFGSGSFQFQCSVFSFYAQFGISEYSIFLEHIESD